MESRAQGPLCYNRGVMLINQRSIIVGRARRATILGASALPRACGRTLAWAALLCVLAAPLRTAFGAPAFETPTLTDVIQINEDGFGSAANKYAFSMVAYDGALYVGTLNIRSMPGMAAFFAGTSTVGLSNGAEIWRYDTDGTWTQIVAGGLGNRSNIGVRKMVVVDDCIFAVTANHDDGMEVWRSCDGWDWTVVADRGFGDPSNTSGRGLARFGDYLYAGTENRRKGAQIWRSDDGVTWEPAAKNGINDRGNIWFSDFVEFDGRLYLGTLNPAGAQLFRTDDGQHFERIFDRGLTRRSNTGVMKVCVFQDRLFVSTADFFHGFDLFSSADGRNFETVLSRGYQDRHYAYLWSLQEYRGRLYAGLYYHRGLNLPTGRFALLSSADGKDWTVENDNGFANPWYYGVRTLTVFNDELIIGSASADKGTKVFSALPRE
jgi:hypothetical protein